MRQVPPETIEEITTFHGKVFPTLSQSCVSTRFPDAIDAGTTAAQEARKAIV